MVKIYSLLEESDDWTHNPGVPITTKRRRQAQIMFSARRDFWSIEKRREYIPRMNIITLIFVFHTSEFSPMSLGDTFYNIISRVYNNNNNTNTMPFV